MNSWNNKRVLVTGGGGFIGSHLVHSLISKGASVSITTSGEPSGRLADSVGTFSERPLTLPDKDAVRSLFASVKPEVVFHLAGLLPSSKRPLAEFVRVNAEGAKELFEAASASQIVKHFVSMGSASEYSRALSVAHEDDPTEPTNDYGRSKLLATEALRHASLQSRITTTVIRPCAVYGSTQDSVMFIPKVIDACLKKERFPMTPAEQQLDFLYIDDLIDGLLRAGKREHGDRFEIINLSSGEEVMLRDVALLIARMCNAEELLDIGALPYSQGEPYKRHLSIEKAKLLLNWVPHTPLAEGLSAMIKHS
jgi:nucleoside-diphosphate-sugar epimerase